jgi:hypothetical protein
MEIFYLGVSQVSWLWNDQVAEPLFVSFRQMRRSKKFRPALERWALDSGGFTELSKFGKWTISPDQYLTEAYQIFEVTGEPDWMAPQDWMCEPWIIQTTGLSVDWHQKLTIENFLELRSRSHLVIPVLQGYELDDYLNHVQMYHDAGVDLRTEALVGVGSICRRQGSEEASDILSRLHDMGLRLHGFGVKGAGIRKYGSSLVSADSLAWSWGGRKIRPCPHTGKASCNHCIVHAMKWKEKFVH